MGCGNCKYEPDEYGRGTHGDEDCPLAGFPGTERNVRLILPTGEVLEPECGTLIISI